jgi:hypothetical protein
MTVQLLRVVSVRLPITIQMTVQLLRVVRVRLPYNYPDDGTVAEGS